MLQCWTREIDVACMILPPSSAALTDTFSTNSSRRCGIAGGYHETRGGGGQTPFGAHQGDLGSKLPPLEGVHTEWKAGGIADVGFMLGANHGGGYLYRQVHVLYAVLFCLFRSDLLFWSFSHSVCPKTKNLTETCLQAHPLSFASSNHTIKYLDGRPSLQIPAIDVRSTAYIHVHTHHR
jgi:hypothetical protein